MNRAAKDVWAGFVHANIKRTARNVAILCAVGSSTMLVVGSLWLRASGWSFEGAISIAVLALGVWVASGFVKSVRKFRRPDSSHWAYTDIGAPNLSPSVLEGQLRDKRTYHDKHLHLTHDWLVSAELLGFSVLSLSTVLWSYKKVTTSLLGFVPTGSSTAVTVWFSVGSYALSLDFGANDAEIARFLAALSSRAPWVIVGYDAKIAAQFRSSDGLTRIFAEAKRKRSGGQSPSPGAT